MSALQVSNVSKIFANSEIVAVDGVSFELGDHKTIALVGESGCGKTTLLRMVAGLENPNEGEITIHQQLVFGKDANIPPHKRKIGFVFQDYALFPHLTVAKNVAFGISAKINRKKIVQTHLDLVELSDLGNRYPHQLSGGQQQRVALARALASNPELLLLDEPFSNLDALIKQSVLEKTAEVIKQKNIATLFVTHDIEDAYQLADQIIILRNGRIQQMGTPQMIKQLPNNDYVRQIAS